MSRLMDGWRNKSISHISMVAFQKVMEKDKMMANDLEIYLSRSWYILGHALETPAAQTVQVQMPTRCSCDL